MTPWTAFFLSAAGSLIKLLKVECEKSMVYTNKLRFGYPGAGNTQGAPARLLLKQQYGLACPGSCHGLSRRNTPRYAFILRADVAFAVANSGLAKPPPHGVW